MRSLAHITSLLRNLFRRKQADQDLDEEVHSYVALLKEEKISAGMSQDQARRQARLCRGRGQIRHQVQLE